MTLGKIYLYSSIVPKKSFGFEFDRSGLPRSLETRLRYLFPSSSWSRISGSWAGWCAGSWSGWRSGCWSGCCSGCWSGCWLAISGSSFCQFTFRKLFSSFEVKTNLWQLLHNSMAKIVKIISIKNCVII